MRSWISRPSAHVAPRAVSRSAPGARTDPESVSAWAAAQDFEAAFLAEMLKTAGVNTVSSSFGGGAGEDAFASFLTAEYGRLIAKTGGVGIAEHVFETLVQRTEGTMINGMLSSGRYARILRLLDLERQVILNGPLSGLQALVDRREAEIAEMLAGGRDAPEAFLDALKRKAERNSRLILASLAGVKAAEAQISQIETEQSRLRTYAADGSAVEVGDPQATRDQRS